MSWACGPQLRFPHGKWPRQADPAAVTWLTSFVHVVRRGMQTQAEPRDWTEEPVWPFCFCGGGEGGVCLTFSAAPAQTATFHAFITPSPHPGLHAGLPTTSACVVAAPAGFTCPSGEPWCVGRGQASFSVHDTFSGRGAGRGLYLDGARLSSFLPTCFPRVI